MSDDAPTLEPTPLVPWRDGGWRVHAFLLFLTVLFSGGIVLNPTDLAIAQPFGDIGQTKWNLWWIDQVLRGNGGEDGSLMFSPVLYYPLGSHLTWHTMEYSWGILLWPVRLLLGANFQHNLALFLATYLTGWCIYLATRQAGGGTLAGIFAAVAITLNSYRLGEVHHLNIFTTYFFPLTLFLLLRLAINPRNRATAVALGIAGILALGTSLFHALACAMLAFVMAAVAIITNRKESDFLRSYIQSLAVAFLVASPVVAWFAWHWFTAPPPPDFGASTFGRGTDLWQFIIPPRVRLPLTGMPSDVVELINAGSTTPLVWYLPGFLLTGFALWRLRKSATLLTLLIIGIALYVLSLGPWLRVGSPTAIDPEPSGIPLPALLLQKLPGLSTMRSLWHFGFLGTMCVAMVGAIKLEQFLGLERFRGHSHLLALLAGAVIGIEVYHGSITSQSPEKAGPAEFLKDAPPGAVLCFPHVVYQVRGMFMYQQTIHGHPIASGYLSRDHAAYEQWMEERQWPAELEDLFHNPRHNLTPEAAANLRSDLATYQFRYLLLFDVSENHQHTRPFIQQLSPVATVRNVEYWEGYSLIVLEPKETPLTP